MPSVTVTASNGHNTVSGLSFRKLKRNGSNGSVDRPYSRKEGIRLYHQRIKDTNIKRSSSANGDRDAPGVDAIRLRLRKGKTGANRNGCVYDTAPVLSYHNNNGPVKAFPLNSNGKSQARGDVAYWSNSVELNSNNSSLPSSSPEISSLESSSSSSILSETRTARIPLQRINGHANLRRIQPLSSTISHSTTDARSRPTYSEAADSSTPQVTQSNSNVANTDTAISSPIPSTLESIGHDLRPIPPQNPAKIKFVEKTLPPGMHEIQSECFVPGAKGYFQHKVNLPLLMNTDAAILQRRSSISRTKKNYVTSPHDVKANKQRGNIKPANGNQKADKGVTMIRSRSSASEIFVQPDVKLIQACWSMIMAFMGDDKTSVQKHHSPRLLGSIVASKRKYFNHSKRIWRKSSSDIPSRTPKDSLTSQGRDKRPLSMFVQPDSGVVSTASHYTRPKKDEPKPQSSSPSSKSSLNTYSHLSVLEKVQFLVNAGIKVPYLRDEIYCLVMKQLIANPSAYSTALGWILLALIMGSFPPSKKILAFVEKFLQNQENSWSKYCGQCLKRTVQNGPRANPPCSLEIKAATIREHILVPVICADHSVRTVTVDPATTSEEILQLMAEKNRIAEPFGFCIVLHAGGKVVRLGAGAFPLMDALSQVEKCTGPRFTKTPCKLFYRRDIFSPRDLFGSSSEHMASWLTYSQICGGVQTGEYMCSEASDLALLIAHQYCVRHGIENIVMRRVMSLCEQCLPPDVFKMDKKNWCKMVMNTLQALGKETRNTINPIDIMGQVIRYAMQDLTSEFTRKYAITTFAVTGGTCAYTSDLTLCLSHQGLTVRQGDAMRILSLYPLAEAEVEIEPIVLLDIASRDLKRVTLDVKRTQLGTAMTITIVGGTSYDITSAHGPEIYAVLFRYIREVASGAFKESQA